MEIDFGGSSFTNNSISGLASGINSNAIINAAVAAQEIPINDLVIEQTEAASQVSALKALKGILNAGKDIANGLKNPLGVGLEDQNAFEFKNGTLTGSPTSVDDATDLLTVTVDPGAAEGDYTVQVTQKAQAAITLLTGFTSQDTDLTSGGPVTPGTFTIDDGTGPENIVINSGATLQDIEFAINNAALDVTATIIQISSTEFQLQITGNDTGTSNDVTLTDTVPVFDGTITVDNSHQNALNATIEFEGNTISRESNTFNDVIEGVTFSIKQAESGTNLNLEIVKDLDVAENSINNFFAFLNEFFIFSAKQTAKDPITGDPPADAILVDNILLKTLTSTLKSDVQNSVAGVTGSFSNFADIGFNQELFEGVDIDGNEDTPPVALFVDEDEQLDTKLLNNFNDVREVFELQFTSDNTNLSLFSAETELTQTSFTLTIDTNNVGSEISVNNGLTATFTPDADAATTGTITLFESDGTEVGKFIYKGDGTDTIAVTITQGLAFQVFDVLEDYFELDGLIDDEIELLENKQDDLEQEIIDLRADVELFKQRLINEFAQVESAVQEANSILQFLGAQQDALNNA